MIAPRKRTKEGRLAWSSEYDSEWEQTVYGWGDWVLHRHYTLWRLWNQNTCKEKFFDTKRDASAHVEKIEARAVAQ